MPDNTEQQPTNGQPPSRLDRIEAAIEALVGRLSGFAIDTHRRLDGLEEDRRALLTAQILLVEAQRSTDAKLAEFILQTNEFIAEARERDAHTGERLNALIAIADDLIRKQPPNT